MQKARQPFPAIEKHMSINENTQFGKKACVQVYIGK